ncbi:MAG TPA: sialidase family protein [Nitrososphaera sp.]|nr:sialidase family protein [Nitrososphaera sp.]
MKDKPNREARTFFKRLTAAAFSLFLLTSIFAIVGSLSSNSIIPAANAEESAETQVITSESLETGQVVAASGSNRFVVWQDDTPGNSDIFFKRSNDNGATWKSSVNLSKNPGDSEDARLIVQDSYVYVVWVQANSAGDQQDVYFRRSTDNGATWGPKVNVSTNGNSGQSALAVSGANVYIAFASSDDDLLFRQSSDHGSSFGSVTTLSPGEFNGRLTMAVSGSYVYVGWEGNGDSPVVRRSFDNGVTWDSEVGLPGAYGYGTDSFVLAAIGPYVYGVWQEAIGCGGDEEIQFSRSTDNAASWEEEEVIGGCEGSPSVGFNAMAVSGSKIFIAYSSAGEIFIKHSTDNGEDWSASVNLSDNPGSSIFGGIAVHSSKVYVIWTQINAGGNLADIFLRRSTDSGATWKAVKNVSDNDGWSEHPQIAVSGSNVYITWDDTTYGDSEILFKRSTNSGGTLKPVVQISDNDGASTEPRMMTIGSSIFIVWTDDSSGNADVLHRRSTSSGSTWKTTLNLSDNEGSSQYPQIAG